MGGNTFISHIFPTDLKTHFGFLLWSWYPCVVLLKGNQEKQRKKESGVQSPPNKTAAKFQRLESPIFPAE